MFFFVQGGRWCGVIHDRAGGQMVWCQKAMLQGEASCEWKEFIFLIPMQVPTWKWGLCKLGFIITFACDSRIFFSHQKVCSYTRLDIFLFQARPWNFLDLVCLMQRRSVCWGMNSFFGGGNGGWVLSYEMDGDGNGGWQFFKRNEF